MINIIEIIMSAIVMFSPLLFYYYYVAYKKTVRESEKKILNKLCLFSTMFIVISLLKYFDNSLYFLLATLPILFSYLYGNKTMIFVSSIIMGTFTYVSIPVNIIYLIVVNLSYVLAYIIYLKTQQKRDFFTMFFCLNTCLATLIYFMINNPNVIININFLFLVFTYALIVFISEILISKASEVINLHMTLKEFEREKVMQSSFFKITHEIKNPIAVCKGYLDMFDVNDKAKSDKYVNIIKTEIDRTLTLLNDFQQFTKITIEKKNFDLNLLLEDVKAAISPLSNKYKVEVDFQTENSLEIYADYNRLKQVMINIIKNGIEASEGRKHSKILITSYIDNGKLYFIVKDNGVGMKKEIMEKLTVPFCTTKQTGSGLGICLSNEIINAHGGRLKFDSKVGYGTTAKVILPIK